MQSRPIEKLFHHVLKELHSVERQLMKVLLDVAGSTSNAALRSELEEHLDRTNNQFARLEDVGTQLGIRFGSQKCRAIEVLISECAELAAKGWEAPVRDLAIISAVQRIEYYEIVSYESALALAEAMELDEFVPILVESLQEEKRMVKALTGLAQVKLKRRALAGTAKSAA